MSKRSFQNGATLVAMLCGLTPWMASADANITIDGSDADWPTTLTTCPTTSGGGGGGIVLDRTCLQNNNSSGSTGNFFSLFHATQNVPTNEDTYFGVSIDQTGDGTLGAGDETWAVHFATNGTSELQVYNTSSLITPLRTYTSKTTCGGTTGADGWNAARNGKVVELSIAYGCLKMSTCNDLRLMQMGVYPNFFVSAASYYNGTSSSLAASTSAVSDMAALTALAGKQSVTLNWTSPADAQGVLVLTGTAAPNTAPTNGRSYAAGAAIGNAKVETSQASGCVSSYVDTTGLTNGTRYYYKVYNVRALTYSTGNIPSSSGIFSEPTSTTSPSPLWCYSTGFTSGVQPVADLGIGVFSGNNANSVTANFSSSTATTDGGERWRPVVLNGSIQTRFPVTAIGGAGKYIVTGDQSGRAYAIDATAGTLLWTANGGTPLATRVQAQPSLQLYSFANAAYQTANPSRDLVFVASGIMGTANNPATTNKVFTLNAATGALVRTYAPNDMDYVSGGMIVDYTNNRLWLANHGGKNGNDSVRIISTIGAQVAGATDKRLSLGAVDTTLSRSADGTQAYIVNNNGLMYAYDLTSMNLVWQKQLSALSSGVFAVSGGFIVARGAANLVERYSVVGTQVTLVWSRTISWPSGINVHYGQQKIYVGDLNGVLHQLDVATGTDEKQITVSSGSRLFAPSIDEGQGRLHLGTMDGRLCAFQVPIP